MPAPQETFGDFFNWKSLRRGLGRGAGRGLVLNQTANVVYVEFAIAPKPVNVSNWDEVKPVAS